MSDPRQTDERLRTWDLSQADRERMCLGVLALDQRFSNVKPRRPQGGRDGARDIEATFENGETVWGAVGFRAKARDSDDDKTSVKNKFTSDIDAALKQNGSLWGFLFFTNIDLTPAEVSELEEIGRKRAVSFVTIYWRERLRIVLDSPSGLSLRYQYLNLNLSDAEQAAFFANYGSKIESILYKGFSATDEMLQRLEFLYDADKPIALVQLDLNLKTECTSDDLGQFRLMAMLGDTEVNISKRFHSRRERRLRAGDPYRRSPRCPICFAGHNCEASGNMRGIAGYVWTQDFSPSVAQNILFPQTASRLMVFREIDCEETPFKSLRELDGRYLSVAVSDGLFEYLESISLLVNGYAVAHLPQWCLHRCADGVEKFPWPEYLQEHCAPWSTLLVNASAIGLNPDPDVYTYWRLDFGRTPPKIGGMRAMVELFKPSAPLTP